MKRILFGVLAAVFSFGVGATTLSPISLLNPAGSAAGQVIASTGPSSAPVWTVITPAAIGGLKASNNLSDVASATAALTNLGGLSTTAAASTYLTQANATSTYATISNLALKAALAAPLSQFAATSSAQLAGVISDETGSGSLVFGTSPAIATPAITGGSINSASVGGTTPSSGVFTTLKSNSAVHLSYKNTSAQSIPASTATTIAGWTSVFDSGSNFNASTGVFTAPNAGYYLVSGEIMFNVSSGAVNNQFQALVIANGVTVFNPIFIVQATTTPLALLPFSVVVSLAAGQTVSVQALQTNTSAQTLNVGANANVLSIVQIP
ncbi:hypothetical protein [Caballeronia sordidicola]|uniref:Uncharacterized protein n=1 Tax=Caballeronia sordidicola TaxID=196367 RepID=A0A242MRI4_CABSO|nr:hypothetical protein [Caballeronia sordidicola]OTP73942.1 hypothetical protein PAMC26510_17450 [Caballeronia sordidicola]